MRILLVPLAGGKGLGPLTRCLAVGHAARERGHDVAFMSKADFCPLIEEFGYKTLPAPTPESTGVAAPPDRLSDVAVELGWLHGRYLELAVEAERQTIRLWQPDMIFTETQLSIPISAAVERVPWAAVANWADHPSFKSPLYSENDTLPDLENEVNRLLTTYQLPTVNDICELAFLRADLKIAPTIPELSPELKDVPDVEFVGYLLSPELEGHTLSPEISLWAADSPLIYVYMSPGDIPPDRWIPTIFDAFHASPFKVAVVLAPLAIPADSLPRSKTIKFLTIVPGGSLIERSQLVVTHGGANTVANAMLAGTPLLVFADYYAERDYNGRAIERHGAGLNYRTELLTPTHVRSAAERLISQPSFKHNARRVGERMRQFGGSRRTVEILERRFCSAGTLRR